MADDCGINSLNRREFIKHGLVFGAGTAGLAAGYAAVPDIFARGVLRAKAAGVTSDKVLVAVQLGGGNDGLNTVIPLNNPVLNDLRPRLAPGMLNKAIPITRDLGLNPSFTGIGEMWNRGQVAIVENVHYEDPSYSHFESTRVYETADPSRRQVEGWLGRLLASQYDTLGHPLTGCGCGADEVPGALRSLQAQLTVIGSGQDFGFLGDGTEGVMAQIWRNTPGVYGALFDTAMSTALNATRSLRAAGSRYMPKADYGNDGNLVFSSKNDLANALQLCAQLIVGGTGVRILHVTLGGFDTHSGELARQDELLAYLDQAITAFHADLDSYGVADKVMTMTWSEFGRRPEENDNQGTDHGSASPMLLIGKKVPGGLYGESPNLTDLDDGGNLKHSVDFRSVYRAALEFLGADASVLGADFPSINQLRRQGPSPQPSPSPSQSPSPSPSPSPSQSPSPSPSPSSTPTPSPSASPTPSPSPTPSSTPTPTPTPTPSHSPTPTPTPSMSPTPGMSPTPTPTPTPTPVG